MRRWLRRAEQTRYGQDDGAENAEDRTADLMTGPPVLTQQARGPALCRGLARARRGADDEIQVVAHLVIERAAECMFSEERNAPKRAR